MGLYEYVRSAPIRGVDAFGFHVGSDEGRYFPTKKECETIRAQCKPTIQEPPKRTRRRFSKGLIYRINQILSSDEVDSPVLVTEAAVAYDPQGNLVGYGAGLAVTRTISHKTGNELFPEISIKALSAKYPHEGSVSVDRALCIPKQCVCDVEKNKWYIENDVASSSMVARRVWISGFHPSGHVVVGPIEYGVTFGDVIIRLDYNVDCALEGMFLEQLEVSSAPVLRKLFRGDMAEWVNTNVLGHED
jgi:hypothetical protein